MRKLFTAVLLCCLFLFTDNIQAITATQENIIIDSICVKGDYSFFEQANELESLEKNIVLSCNEQNLLPIKELGKKSIYWHPMGSGESESFENYLKKYAEIKCFGCAIETIPEDDYLIISYHPSNSSDAKSVDKNHEEFIKNIAKRKNTIFVLFDEPFIRYPWKSYSKIQSVIIAYENNLFAHIAVAELIFGAIKPQGKLSAEIRNDLQLGKNLTFEPLNKLTYGFPDQVGFNDNLKTQLDSIVKRVVQSTAAPSCQVLVARKGKVIYDNFYGTSMACFPKSFPTCNNSIHDMASVTKIMACLPLVMKMYNEGVWKLSDELGDLLPKYKNTNKSNLKMIDILTHTSGLKSWIPFYLKTLDENSVPLEQWYSKTCDETFTQQICDSLFAKNEILSYMDSCIVKSSVSKRKRYVYSDLAFIIMREFIEYHYKKPIEELVQTEFYEPLGMSRSTYRPLEKFSKDEIIPSENDVYWRHKIVHGYVHDMAAAFMNGVSGHAGLFSTANDMAIMAQMYLQNGEYGGRRYLKKNTLERFSSCPKCEQKKPVQRGIGFDLYKNYDDEGRKNIYGHTGFTGTALWIDPTEELVVIFLSNRTFLSMKNNLLSKESFRTKVMQIVYSSLE